MIKILIAGDFCSINRVDFVLKQKKQEEIFRYIIPLIDQHDYSVVNLECPVVAEGDKPIPKQGPNLSASIDTIVALKFAGFKLITLANNHFYDYGENGVRHTISCCNTFGLDTIGGGDSLNTAKKLKVKKILEKRIAFINICEHEFSIATQTTGGSNPLNPISNYYDIQEAKAKADYVIVIVHGGHEHYQLPSPRMQETYRFFVDIGADVVVNHHQHCFSGYETYKGKPIFYGLGNFCFDNPSKRNTIWNEGCLLSLCFDERDNIFALLIPYKQCNEEPTISLLKGNEKMAFDNKISDLNKIIEDSCLLRKSFEDFCTSQKRLYLSLFEPYPGRYLKYIYRKGWLPSLLSEKVKLFAQNFLDCESHYDVMKEVVKMHK